MNQQYLLGSPFQMMNSFNLKRQFNQFKAVIHNLKLCRILHDHLIAKKQIEKRKFIFESWIETAFSYRRASRFRRVKLLGNAISNIIQGIANTRYLDKCERNGEVLRNQSLKRGFLQFLQESTLYLKSRRHHLQALKEQFNQSRLHKLFMGFLMYRIANLRHKGMLSLAKEDHNRNIKKKLLLSLKRNMTVSKWLHSKLDAYMTKLKAEGFTFLRYSSAKQKALRDRYYDHVVSQSRTLALGCLQLWQNKCTEKMERRAMFAEKTVIFSKKRFFFAMRSKMSRKQKSLMKVGLFINYTQNCLLSKVISVLCDRTFSEEGQQRKRARIYARIKTISKVLRGLFQNAKIQRTYKQITIGKLQKQRLQFFNIWNSAFLSTQVNKEALVLQIRRRVKSLFRAWHLTAAEQRRERNKIYHARKIYVHKWLRKGITALKENVVQSQVYYELSPQQEKLAHLQKLGVLLSTFQKTCVQEAKIRKAFNSVNRRQLKNTFSAYLNIMKQQYHLSVGFKQYATLKPLQIKKKVFSFFKAKLRQRKQEQRYQLQAEKHEQKIVERKAFRVLNEYMNHRRNTQAMKQIAERVYLTKVVIGRAYRGLKGYWEVKRYLANQEQAFKETLLLRKQSQVLNVFKQKHQASRLLLAAEVYHKRKAYLRFQSQLELQKSLKAKRFDFELQTLSHLALKLQKRAFSLLKMFTQHSKFIKQLKAHQTLYQRRKWFEVWRHKFVNKNHYNYLCEVQRGFSSKKKKRYASVTFKNAPAGKRSEDKSPVLRAQSTGRRTEVFRNLTNDFQL